METLNMFLAIFVLGVVNVLAEKNLPLTGIAYVEGPDRRVTGNITFTQNQCGEPVFIRVYVQGLEPGLHGFHVHEKGDLTNGCMSAGGHYNPDKMDHGAPSDEIRHVGDLGNIRADALGIADTTLTDHLISLAGPRSVFGRALVIHTGEDDLGLGNHPDSKKTGNAGGRAACGVIGIKSPADGFWKVCSAGTAVKSASYFYSIASAVTILVYSILKL